MSNQKKITKTSFKKGSKRPPNAGRKAGTPNKKTQTWNEFVKHSQEGGLEEFLERMKKLTDWQYCRLYVDLLEFHKPRLQRVLFKDETETDKTITVEMVMERIKKLKEGEKS